MHIIRQLQPHNYEKDHFSCSMPADSSICICPAESDGYGSRTELSGHQRGHVFLANPKGPANHRPAEEGAASGQEDTPLLRHRPSLMRPKAGVGVQTKTEGDQCSQCGHQVLGTQRRMQAGAGGDARLSHGEPVPGFPASPRWSMSDTQGCCEVADRGRRCR